MATDKEKALCESVTAVQHDFSLTVNLPPKPFCSATYFKIYRKLLCLLL